MDPDFSVHEAPDVFAVQEPFHGHGWTDGLPVVPPTGEAVAACLEAAAMRGGIDRSTLGHPGKLSICIAEDEEGSPWEPLAVEPRRE